ncbi:AtpZ/AtpI family protein [bacterium]|nr:MAG: AtpZ/AtpI family protein [bacterium]
MGEDNNNKTGVFKGLYELASIGITLAAATFIGLLIGIYIDGYFDTKPWFTIIFLIFGIIAGFKNLYHTTKKYGSK